MIDSFEELYQDEHLLDMVVEATDRLRQDYATNEPFPLIFDHDSSYQATLCTEDKEYDISIHAKHMTESARGKVVKFPRGFRGIITKENKELTDEDGSLILQCVVIHKSGKTSLSSSGYFEIDNTQKSLLFFWSSNCGLRSCHSGEQESSKN